MQANGSITYKQMMSVLNINSPRDIIRQLKKDGVPILTERVQYTKKDGTKSFYHKFSMQIWRSGMDEMIKRIKPYAILVYGGEVEYDYKDIPVCYYENKVTERLKNEKE